MYTSQWQSFMLTLIKKNEPSPSSSTLWTTFDGDESGGVPMYNGGLVQDGQMGQIFY